MQELLALLGIVAVSLVLSWALRRMGWVQDFPISWSLCWGEACPSRYCPLKARWLTSNRHRALVLFVHA